MSETLISIAADILGVSVGDVSSETSRESAENWDSMNHLRLITALEEQYGIQFSMQEIEDIQTIDDVQQLLTRHGAG
ncbi:MAG: acyl carrier protein [Pseudomonadota bacterium]